ncbi:hydrogenase formation protein HypD [Methylohalobius crimeensis]|uniref:hydrogenase formation protein HypD n=1 Tax=Methylohalobius crimeensis TaxID=244365 RepID=UPI0003B572C7|nr:hydrogenase formation protein HypD [Methylohalobius crimeensis]
MQLVDEFRDPAKGRALVEAIRSRLEAIAPARPLQIMEFCGGHTHAIFRYGLNQMLPEAVEWVHGPGCPVCVLPRERVDAAVEMARRPEVIFTSFGDALRVPGSAGSLREAGAEGADVRVVYSPLDALEIARRHPDREVVFFAIGFETTMPATALTVLRAEAEEIPNFSLLCHHITTPAAVRAILDDPDLSLDGIVAPGHVASVVGADTFRFIPTEYRVPTVVSGFEPLDILQSLWMVLGQLEAGKCRLENQYRRVVNEQGSRAGRAAIERVYELAEHSRWRGLGEIDRSGVRLRPNYARFDAERRFGLVSHVAEEEALPCGEVLKGRLKPRQCPHFGGRCRPEAPLGALMVSSEGACAAYFRYTA